MPQFFWDLQQGSLEWYRRRAGIPTSSEFDCVMTPKTKQRSTSYKKYAARIVAGRLLNWQADDLNKISHVEAGRQNEPLAVGALEEIYQLETTPIGLVTTNDGRFGASPDRVAGVSVKRDSVSMTIEAKCPTIPVQFERLLFGDSDAYKCQRQGHLLVCEADKAVFVSYHPRTPLYRVEEGRDEAFIKALRDCLEWFSDELEALTLKARGLGFYEAFPELLLPLDAERGPEAHGEPMPDIFPPGFGDQDLRD